MDGLKVDWEFDFDNAQSTYFIGSDIWSPELDGVNDFTILNDQSSTVCEDRDCTFIIEFSRNLLTGDF